MSKYQVWLFTCQKLSETRYAEKVYEIFDKWEFPPNVFDIHEPIRQPWVNRDDFVGAWRDESKQYFGQVLIERKKSIRYYADVCFHFGPNRIVDNKPPYHGFSVYDVKESQCRGEDLKNLVKLADQLFTALDMDYGFICLGDEYDAKNVVKNFRHPDGSLEPRHVIGMKWPYCLPGLYWINYFGTRYLERGFAMEIDTSHSSNVVKIDGGIRFQTSEDPRFFESAESATTEYGMRETLGKRWFYDRNVDPCEYCSMGDYDWINSPLEDLRSP